MSKVLRTMRGRRRRHTIGMLALAITATGAMAGCTGEPTRGATTPTSNGVAAGANTVPRLTLAPTTTEPRNAPPGTVVVEEFHAPTTFQCMNDGSGEAQVTVGWKVPTATAHTITMDGAVLPQGLNQPVPYDLPAGRLGATVVFRCDAGESHDFVVAWRDGDAAPVTERRFTTRKGAPA